MSYQMTKCKLAPIDRIRGCVAIPVIVACTFERDGKEYEVSGMALCNDEAGLQEAYATAVTKAEELFKTLAPVMEPIPDKGPVESLIKSMVDFTAETERKKYIKNVEEYNQMNSLATEEKQKTVNGLCEALGITPIDILSNGWTMIEVLVLINYLEKMTEPIAGDN